MTTPALPSAVTVYEVGARDGLQNQKTTIPTEVKAEFIRRLIAAGVRAVELTSFVPPRWIPQLGDAAELMELLGPLDVRAPVLVPNERGLERALDTIGVATPNAVIDLLEALTSAGIPPDMVAVHSHDTCGQALANTFTALIHAITTVDSSAGGLGGCPCAESATGNLATEDLLWQLHGIGIHTGIDLEAVTRTSLWMAEQLGRPSPSRTVQALSTTFSKVAS